MAGIPVTGTGLEARFQRLFLAQGIFAERELYPSVSGDRRMIATDIDVLVSEYNYGFHPTRLHAECKGGDIRPLDRVLWLAGVRKMLEADASYLILPDFNNETAQFAWNLDVKLLTLRQLLDWEGSLTIPEGAWPCRSDFATTTNARGRWRSMADNNRKDASWQLYRTAMSFVEIESWLSFSYGSLNRLFRLLQQLSSGFSSSDRDKELAFRYATSALLVRMAQYLLAVCLDVTNVNKADVPQYLTGRLIFGDRDATSSVSLIDSTVTWVRRALEQAGSALPVAADVSRLFSSPPYSEEFVGLIERLLTQSQHARHLPMAVEGGQFGTEESSNQFPLLRAAISNGQPLSALLSAFLLRGLKLSKEVMMPIGNDLRDRYASSVTASLSGTQRGRLQRSRASTRGLEVGDQQPVLTPEVQSDSVAANDTNQADPEIIQMPRQY